MKERKIIVWFKNDLRTHDQEALYKAASKTLHVIPVYCFDPRQLAPTPLGFSKTGAARAQFLIESVADLRATLQKIGADLVIRVGKPEEVIPTLVDMTGATAVYASKEIAAEEISVEERLEAKLWAKKIPLELFWTSTLFHLDDIPYPIKNIPDSFNEFRKESEKATKVRTTFPAPTRLASIADIHAGALPTLLDVGYKEHISPDTRAVMVFKGGETYGLQRLNEYFWIEDRLREYKETRNNLLGAGYSTKLSCWLAMGCLSPRKVYEEVKRYEALRIKNDSTSELIYEMLWRDYFQFIARKYGNQIFKVEGMKNDQRLTYTNDRRLLQKWMDGETGVPFVDANMRELKYTGYMSNRGRQNVASFLANDLKVNWTFGAMYFESQQLDYDASSNWCNWNYMAGVGNDPRENRYLNILNQAKRYDPQGEYVKCWLPELEEVPADKVHQVAELSLEEQKQYGVVIGLDYPPPLFSYEKWLA